MSPCTCWSHTKGTADSTDGNENQIHPLQTSIIANTKKHSKVAARRVIPDSQPCNVQSGASRTTWGKTRLTRSQALGKRTYVLTQTPIDTHGTTSKSSAMQAKTTKKAQNIGKSFNNNDCTYLPTICSKSLPMAIWCLSCYPVGMKLKVANLPAATVLCPSSSAKPVVL